jgi:hypothetical protein
MELRRRSVCNQPKGLYGINPKGKYPTSHGLHTPAAITYSLREITYQSFGLDKNKRKQRRRAKLAVKLLQPNKQPYGKTPRKKNPWCFALQTIMC